MNGGSGRLRTECPSVPIVVGGEVLVLWAPQPRCPFSPVPPRPTSSGWELQPPALSQPSLWAYGRTCHRCGRLRGYSATLYSRIDSPLTLRLCRCAGIFPRTYPSPEPWRGTTMSGSDPSFFLAIFLSLRPVGRLVCHRTFAAPPRGRLWPWTSCGGPMARRLLPLL